MKGKIDTVAYFKEHVKPEEILLITLASVEPEMWEVLEVFNDEENALSSVRQLTKPMHTYLFVKGTNFR